MKYLHHQRFTKLAKYLFLKPKIAGPIPTAPAGFLILCKGRANYARNKRQE